MSRYSKLPRVDIRRRSDEQPVKNGLSITPSQMYDMALAGKAVTTSNLPDNVWDDGYDTRGTEIAPYDRRFVEPTDLWELSRDANKKINTAIGRDKRNREYQQRLTKQTETQSTTTGGQ